MPILIPYFLTQTLGCLPQNESWLSPGEKIRLASLRFSKRRSDWTLGRWTAKVALRSYYIRIGQEAPDYPALEIRNAPDGAPEVFLAGRSARVSMALSHSGGTGFCVLTDPMIKLGCDLETIQARDRVFMEDYFCEEESAFVAEAPAGENPWLVTLIWSAKESALKCLRAGLRRDTRSVLVGLDRRHGPGWNPLTVRCLESSRLFYGWWMRAGAYVHTVAADLPSLEPVAL